MSRRVFFLECSGGYWARAAESLATEQGWEVLVWVGGQEMADVIARLFPRAIFQTSQEAVRGIPAPELADTPWLAVDEPLLERLAAHESLVIKMMDRMDGGGDFSHGLRTAHYHRLLGYWGGVLDRLKPDLVVFTEPPHVVFDYVLYALCLDRDIATAMFPANPVFPHLALPVARVDCHSPALARNYERLLAAPENGRPRPSQAALRYISDAAKPPDEAPLNKFVASRIAGPAQGNPISRLARDWLHPRSLRYRADRLRHFLGDPAPPSYEKLPGQDIDQPAASGLAWRRNELKGQRLRRELLEAYLAACGEPDWESPSIYVALHYQPEQTTSPSGGVFVHQTLMVRLISQCLPDGWRIHVKEHMLQFRARRGQFGRHPSAYRELAEIPNVTLVSPEISGFSLMDSAQAVATVTGTTGFEALCRGKPVLLFGHAWYQLCRGIFKVRSREQVASAFAAIVDGAGPKPAEVEAFAAAFEATAHRACPNGFLLKKVDMSDEENAEGIARALSELTGD